LFAVICFTAAVTAHALTLNVRDCGAAGDGVKLDTKAIQAAIDKCATTGGGTVLLADGRFLSGTIHLRSHVTLRIEAEATLLGSTNAADYSASSPTKRSNEGAYGTRGLISGDDLENVALTGDGLIDGQGGMFSKSRERPRGIHPYVIRLANCRDVRVEGLRLRNSAAWMQHYFRCERVTLRGIRVWNYCNLYNDGLDLNGCKDVLVSQCVIESGDDAIVLKSTSERPTESVVISDCIARSHSNGIKLGTESNGGFKNVTIANCVVTSPSETNNLNGRARGYSGITLALVDGGQLERVAIANIAIHGVSVPLFLRLGDRGRLFKRDMQPQPIGTFRNVVINNIIATDVGTTGCSITGQPGHPIENVLLSNLTFTFEGGGARELATKEVPELPKDYPECVMFGNLPAYGFYGRHVKGLRFSNVQLRTSTRDLRHAIVLDDVTNVMVDGLDAQFWPGGAPMMSLVQSRDVLIRGCQWHDKKATFLQVIGDSTSRVALVANHFDGVTQPVTISSDVPKGAVSIK